MNRSLRFGFAGDRDISVWVLDFLLSQGARPLALLVPDAGRGSHVEDLLDRCSFLNPSAVLRGSQFREASGIETLEVLDLDFLFGIHFPYLVPDRVLRIPRHGFLNLHPAYLPYNRGWHTPTWALLEGKPIGATLHFMDSGVDTGDIVHQKRLTISPSDTADSLYQRLKRLEMEVFAEAWPRLVEGSYQRRAQKAEEGTFHKKQDLFREAVQKIDLEQIGPAGDVLLRLRALTTNRKDEAAYFEVDSKRYRVRVTIEEE